LFFGLLAASFFSRAVLLRGVNADVPSPRIISWAVRAMIVLFVISMAFEELSIGSRTVIVAFTLTFGSLMLGLALAFGLGGKDLARSIWSAGLRASRLPEKKTGREKMNFLHCERDKVPVAVNYSAAAVWILVLACTGLFRTKFFRRWQLHSRPVNEDISKYLLNKNLSAAAARSKDPPLLPADVIVDK